ncbi:MAG: hypothetical protein PF508_06985 [Spirochaeta sp.]|nr:hypothetical protein [Spirochaeta sp.]
MCQAHLRHLRTDVENQIAEHRTARTTREPHARERMLRRYQDSIIRELATPDSVLPADLRHAPGTVEERLSVIQKNYGRWADLLDVWPEILAAAREIPPPGIANRGAS